MILHCKDICYSIAVGGLVMLLTEANQKLINYNQIHLLKYYNELNDDKRKNLIFDILNTNMEVFNGDTFKAKKKSITPLKALELSEIKEQYDYFKSIGIKSIRDNEVAAVLLAGGMGTRLGSDNPKGMYNIGVQKDLYIFECLINNLLDVVREANTWIHLFVMTSDKNNDATIAFMQEHDYFGYNSEYVHFFKQEMAPTTDYDGKIYLEEKWKLSTSPNGNGGWFISMKNAGLIDVVHNEGIQWLNVFSVDNVLQRIADPCFVGAVLDKKCSVGSKVVRKTSPEEKVGVMCLEDGKPSIVEYYELTDEMKNAKDEKGNPSYNFGVTLNYLFRVLDLEKIMENEMPLHIVEKKIEYIDDNGNKVIPEKPNGYKYETLVLDMIHQMDSCLPFEVDREKEFAPIKNLTGDDSVDTARDLLVLNGVSI